MKLTVPGTAWLKSKTDPKWNVYISCNVGGFMMPTELKKEFDNKKKELGQAPEDLEWGYMKD